MQSTASDVARLAGVSVSTVSRAIAAPHMVSATALHKVQQAAATLNYRPNRAARGLATGRTGNLGLVVPDLENPFFSSITKAVHNRARALGYALFVADTDEDSEEEPEIIGNLAKQVDGVILCSSRATDAELLERSHGTRVVLVNRKVGDLPSVSLDSRDGVRQAVRHLWALGHRHIAYAGGPRRSWIDSQRREALEVAASEFEGVDAEDLGAFQPYFSGGVAAADLLLASQATAVIAYNDLMAFGLLDRVKQRGQVVPRDLSVVSFDNIMLASSVSPPLTTASAAPQTLAREAIDLLRALMADDGPRVAEVAAPSRNLQRILPVDLQVRGSTGPVPYLGTAAR